MLDLTACTVDLDRGHVLRDGVPQTLTARELELLRFLVARAGQVVPRDELLREVWGYNDAVVSRASDNTIRRLREKIERDPSAPDHVLTSFGAGYRFVRVAVAAELVPPAPHRVAPIGDTLFDLTARRLHRGDERIELTEAEARVLETLLDAGGEVVERQPLARAAWGRVPAGSRKLDGLMVGLRAKLEPDPHQPLHLLTLRGRGFRLQSDPLGAPPPSRPPPAATRLPTEREPFVGRRAELGHLRHALDEGARLSTLLGPGGIGKTRLAIRHAWSCLERWPGGAWFCDLTEASTRDEIAFAVSRALDTPLGPDPQASVGRALAGLGRCLVVLDNFEQVVAHAEPTIGAWLEAAPEASFLVTSRERLGIPGELTIAVGPMDPDDALALFELRARWVRRDFVLADEQPSVSAALVARLDHLPLAIELAASRIRSMSPAEILERLEQRFRLLVSASPAGRPARQVTMRATLDWSWELLDPVERSALAQLSVLEGPFSLPIAESVLDVGDAWPADVLQALIERSLVQRGNDEGTALSLLWSVKDYARQRATELGVRAEAERRHGRTFVRLCVEEGEWVLPMLPDVIAACRRALAAGDVSVAGPTAIAAANTLDSTGPFSLSESLTRAALDLPDATPRWRARFALKLGEAIRLQGRFLEAGRHFEDARAFARLGGDRIEEAASLVGLASLRANTGHLDEALDAYREVLAIHRERGATRSEVTVLSNMSLVFHSQGRYAEARDLLLRSTDGHRAAGDIRGLAFALAYLGIVLVRLGLPDEARAALEEARRHARALSVSRVEVMVHAYSGLLELAAGRWAEGRRELEAAAAIAGQVGSRAQLGGVLTYLGASYSPDDRALVHLHEALAIHRESRNREEEGTTLLALGRHHAMRGELSAARPRFDEALSTFHEAGLRDLEGEALVGVADLLARRGALGEAEGLLDLARPLSAEAPAALAGIEHVLGGIRAREGRPDDARTHFAAARRAFLAIEENVAAVRVLRSWAALEQDTDRPEQAEALLAEAEALGSPNGPHTVQ